MSAAALASFGIETLGTLAAIDKADEARAARSIAARSRLGIKQIQAMQARRAFKRSARQAIAETTSGAIAHAGGLDSSAFLGSAGSLVTQREVGVAEQRAVLTADEKARRFDVVAGKKDAQGQEILSGAKMVSSAIGAFGGMG